MTIRPQPGPQEDFLSSTADITIYGGAAGGGKSYALLLEPLRHLSNPDFRCVFFRRTYSQITMEGGLWDEAQGLYSPIADLTQSPPTAVFESGARIAFRHLQHEKDRLGYQGAQIPLICFDELTHFTERQFFYLLSRNRSAKAGIRPYVRATTNPDPDSWVKSFISWWIDPQKGTPIPERSGKTRHFIRQDGEIIWGKKAKLIQQYPDALPKSVSFIPARLEDNKILCKNDPSYRANLEAQDRVTRARLLEGNWAVRRTGGTFFRRHELPIWTPDTSQIGEVCRFWDMASTKPSPSNTDPDYLAGVLLAKTTGPYPYAVLDIKRHRVGPGQVEMILAQTAMTDSAMYPRLIIRTEQQPGSAGKDQTHHLKTGIFKDYDYEGIRPTGPKTTRALSVSALAEQGKLALKEGDWNEAFIQEATAFPDPKAHDDQVDALSGAYAALTAGTEKEDRRKAFSALRPQKIHY